MCCPFTFNITHVPILTVTYCHKKRLEQCNVQVLNTNKLYTTFYSLR